MPISKEKVRVAISINREFYSAVNDVMDYLNDCGCNPPMTFSKLVTIALCEFLKTKCYECESCENKITDL